MGLMSGISICEVDFEEWMALASSEPQNFEQLRQDKISELIKSAPKRQQHRLHCLQWRIDQIREQNKASPMAACLSISELMWDTFNHLSELLQYQAKNGLNQAAPPLLLPAADVLHFPSKA